MWAGRRGPVPGGLWALAVLAVGVLGFFAPQALGPALPGWVPIVLATALALAVAGLRLSLILRRQRRDTGGTRR